MLVLLPPVIGGIVNVVAQVLVCRVKLTGLMGSIVVGFVLGLLATLAAQALLPPVEGWAGLAAAAANLAIFACGGYTYFHFLNMGETARRIRLLRELTQAGADGLTVAQLSARYNCREMLERRLDRLRQTGIIVETDGRLHIVKRSALIMPVTINAFKRLLLGRDFRARP